MLTRRAHLASGQLAAALTALRRANGIDKEFPPAVTAEAEAFRSAPAHAPALDLRGLRFVTLDPPESRDLDQAFHIERHGTGRHDTGRGGWTLRYAIADVPAVVTPGSALDAEARRRGQTLYLPDGAVPLHPRALSEDLASLLPGVDRDAYVWTIAIDEAGAAEFEGGDVPPARVERARIRSRAKLGYGDSQLAIDAGTASPPLALLREFGELRIGRERLRGGATLSMPDEEVVRDAHGYRIERRLPLPVEDWNAQLSLLTGMAAGNMMLSAGIGILRTMAAPDAGALASFRARVAALGMPWPRGMSYGDYLRELPRDTPGAIAVLKAAVTLFRGAGYDAFGVPDEAGVLIAPPEQPEQAAIAAPYAHVTAPLRRLVDRWGLVICEALSAGREVPSWAAESLTEVPALMRASSSLAGRLGSEALDRIEAALLRDRAGEEFDVVVLERRAGGALVQLVEPAVTAVCSDPEELLIPGHHARVRVLSAEVASGKIRLEAASGPAAESSLVAEPLRA